MAGSPHSAVKAAQSTSAKPALTVVKPARSRLLRLTLRPADCVPLRDRTSMLSSVIPGGTSIPIAIGLPNSRTSPGQVYEPLIPPPTQNVARYSYHVPAHPYSASNHGCRR